MKYLLLQIIRLILCIVVIALPIAREIATKGGFYFNTTFYIFEFAVLIGLFFVHKATRCPHCKKTLSFKISQKCPHCGNTL